MWTKTHSRDLVCKEKHMQWHECLSCEKDFKIKSESVDDDDEILFCPFCGATDLEREDPEEEEEWSEEVEPFDDEY